MTVMGSDTEYLPDEITYGFVADRVLLAIGDTTGDDDRFPDGVPAKGTVRFSPERTILYTQETPATVLPQDIECTIYHRDHPVAVNNGYEPELVGKLVDPAGHVGNVALIVGWYEAVYRLETGTAQRFRFKVRPEHTAENPLWLPEVAPLQPTPSERFVVNEQVYNDTKTARDQAEQYRDTTRTLRNETETYRDQAEGYRNEAGQSATSAAEILSDVQDLGIRVDTSVGTRVFVGDTMIHGDTGWREIPQDPDTIRTGGRLLLRRQNNFVRLRFEDVTLSDGSGSGLLVHTRELPTGFNAPPFATILQIGQNPGQTSVNYIRANHSLWWIRNESLSGQTANRSNVTLAGEVFWPAPDTFPTSRPGTPA